MADNFKDTGRERDEGGARVIEMRVLARVVILHVWGNKQSKCIARQMITMSIPVINVGNYGSLSNGLYE